MSKKSDVTSGDKGDAGGEPNDEIESPDAGGEKGDKVSLETYQKTLKQKKTSDARIKELESALAEKENDKLSLEGKKDELLAKLKADNDRLSKEQKATLSNFVFASLENQVRAKAASLGCIDLDAIGKLVDLSDIEVDSKTFKADEKEVASVIEGLKKSKPYLFNKAGPKLNTKMPNGKIVESQGGKKLGDLTKEEIWAELRNLKK